MVVSQAVAGPHWLAKDPSKRWTEVFFLAYSPFWIIWALLVLVPFQLYEVSCGGKGRGQALRRSAKPVRSGVPASHVPTWAQYLVPHAPPPAFSALNDAVLRQLWLRAGWHLLCRSHSHTATLHPLQGADEKRLRTHPGFLFPMGDGM